MTRRRSAPLAALLAAGVLLTACTPGPAPREVRAEAQAQFDDLVDVLAEADPAVLRSVTVAPLVEEACGADGEEPGTRTSLVATGTLSITSDDTALAPISEEVAAVVDEDVWDRIRPRQDAGEQRAWASETGVVATVTTAAPTVVIAVFTPCLR